jgi:hypothetical protein
MMVDFEFHGLDFEENHEYIDWKESVSEEEHRRVVLSKNQEYTETYSEAANDLRLCI